MPRQKKNTATKRAASTARFGPVSTINTAPVAIGNSIRGSAPTVKQTQDGMRITGRDFAFSLSSTAASVTNWELIGAMPLTPSVLASSGLRAFTQSYAKFKIHRLIFHYITSSPTSQAGDVLFYFNRDRCAPFPDCSNSNFLPFVLSDPKTVLGPQWTNHSVLVSPPSSWKSTNYGTNPDINEDAAGEIALYSKTSATNSPGYIIMDYDITFAELSVNPRAGVLPVSRGIGSQVCIGGAGWTVSAGSSVAPYLTGNTVAGVATVNPAGLTAGDIFKVVASATVATVVNTWTGVTPSTLLRTVDDRSIALDDGFTCYARYNGATQLLLYMTKVEAETNSGSLEYQTALTAAAWYLPCTIFLVGTISEQTQNSY